MSDTPNGNGAAPPRMLSLDQARQTKTRKGNDLITVQQAYDMVIQECAKVHEYYLEQIPTFVARMTQDALLHYQLIKPIEPVDIPPAVAAKMDEIASELAQADDRLQGDLSVHNRIPLDTPPAEPAKGGCQQCGGLEFLMTNPPKCIVCGWRKPAEPAPDA